MESLLRDLQSQQLVPINSQSMESLLSNLQGKKLVPVNSQPIESLLRDLQSQQLVPMSSQSMESLLSNLQGNLQGKLVPANQEHSQRSSKPTAGPNKQPVNGEPSQQSSRQACPSEQPANQEPSQQFSEQQPLQASKDWYLKPYSLDLTTSPEETVDDLNYSSSDGSDVIVRSESNVIMIDVDLSTKESVINVGTQTDVVPYCKCEDVITAITRLTHVVQTLSSQVDTYFERLTGQLNLALDAIISHRS